MTTWLADPGPLETPAADLEQARAGIAPEISAALERAAENVARVAEAALREDRGVVFSGHEVRLREAPVRRAAVYVPGGRAPYPSTVIMGAVTAAVPDASTVARNDAGYFPTRPSDMATASMQ